MTLAVYTARISTRDPHRFDVTRQSGDAVGRVFAPSWAILTPALAALRCANDLDTLGATERARDMRDRTWAAYEIAYRAEMLDSYRRSRAQWLHLLGKRRVVLCCYCTDAARCHRTLLAGYLGKLGAEVCGELTEAPTSQIRMQGVT